MIFDSHAHYDDEQFDIDREELIEEIKRNGVIGVLNCGASVESYRKTYELANKYDFIYGALGVHPENANEVNPNIISEIRELCKNSKIKAIGEIGLDYYYEENPSRDVQKKAFRDQMELAKELNLPVIIHDRDAHEDTLNIMKEFPQVTGVIHCFSGSKEFAIECLKLGYYIGFTGVLTFKNARKLVDVCEVVPLDKILVETDCPYMAPVPFRGKRNRSDYINNIINTMAQIKNIEVELLNKQLIENTKKMLRIT